MWPSGVEGLHSGSGTHLAIKDVGSIPCFAKSFLWEFEQFLSLSVPWLPIPKMRGIAVLYLTVVLEGEK